MRARTLHTDGEQRTVAIVLSTGDEAMACLKAFAEREHVTAAQFTAIGAFAGATLGYFDWTTKQYRRTRAEHCSRKLHGHTAAVGALRSWAGDLN